MTDVEAACRDLGWRIICERAMMTDPPYVFIAWILGGHGPNADAVELGMSEASRGHAIREAWRSAVEFMGSRLVHRLGGTID